MQLLPGGAIPPFPGKVASRRAAGEQGVILVIWAVALSALLAFVSGAILLGNLEQNATNFQNAADSGALAAASAVGSGGLTTASEQAAGEVAQGVASSTYGVTNANWDSCQTPAGFLPASADDDCVAFSQDSLASTEVVQAGPSISLTVPNVAPAGGLIEGTNVFATLTGTSGVTSAGTVNFFETDQRPAACPTPTDDGGWTEVPASVPVSGDGLYDIPGDQYYPSTPGDYWWSAYYSGDSNNAPASTLGCATTEMMVEPDTTAEGLSVAAPDQGTLGTPLGEDGNVYAQLTNTVPSTAGDVITFYVSATPSETAPTCVLDGGTGWQQLATETISTAEGSSANNLFPIDATFAPSETGGYWWDATFTLGPSDTTNTSADSSCTEPEETVISQAQPAIAVSAPATAAPSKLLPAGDVSATITGASDEAAAGQITFYSYGPSATPPNACPLLGGTGWQAQSVVDITGDGTYAPGTDWAFTPLAGNYWWDAEYGDGNDLPADSSCSQPRETVVATPIAQPSLSLSVPNTAVAGAANQGATVTGAEVAAQISGTTAGATGTVTFWVSTYATSPTGCPSLDDAALDTTENWTEFGSVATDGEGVYSPAGASFTTGTVGDYDWYASYSEQDGTTVNVLADSGCGVVAWVELPDQTVPGLLGNSGAETVSRQAYAVYANYDSGASLCSDSDPDNCSSL